MFARNRTRLRAWRGVGLVALCALAALLVALAAPSSADAARMRCAGTFRVLHDDHVGALALPRGNYTLTILASGRPGCTQAAALFTRFLEDYDGRLPGGWRVVAGNSSFVRAAGVGFRVVRTGGGGGGEEEESGGGGRHPLSGGFCPAPFRVLHNDHIGSLQVPRGDYSVVLLQKQGLTCIRAEELFARFLEDVNGYLPLPWLLEPQTATFLRSAAGPGFRIKPLS